MKKNTFKFSFSIRDICEIGISAAVMAVMAQIVIPLPGGVPITMQTFAIMLAGVVLGAKKGCVAAFVYVLLGAAGAPVFAGFAGGLGAVAGATGGFITTFPILAFCAGIGTTMYSRERNIDKSLKKIYRSGKTKLFILRLRGKGMGEIYLFTWLVAGVLFNYFCGMLWFGHIMSYDLLTSFVYCVLPFVPADCVKVILAAVAGRQIKSAISRIL